MELSTKSFENGVTVSIKGEVDSLTSPDLTSCFKEQMEKQKNIIADFSEVDYISSAGLRVLLATVKEVRRMGGDLRLTNLHANVAKVLNISGFVRILKVFPDIESAESSFTE